jgi:hypothetical protein
MIDYRITGRGYRIKTYKKETCGTIQSKMVRSDTGRRQADLKYLAIHLKGNIVGK